MVDNSKRNDKKKLGLAVRQPQAAPKAKAPSKAKAAPRAKVGVCKCVRVRVCV